MSKHRKGRKKDVLVIQRPLLPLQCSVGDSDAKHIHYNAEYMCDRTGREFCSRHYHGDACCRRLSFEVVKENRDVADMYIFGLPKCPFCQIKLPPDLKKYHMSDCIKAYVKGHVGDRHKVISSVVPQSIFVQDKDITYPTPAAIARRERSERVAKFVEEP